MNFVQNFPFFSIILSMFSGTVCSVLPRKVAKAVNLAMLTVVGIMSACVLSFTIATGESFTFMMGHFPAPWGNEIRAGALEAGMALFFCIVMILSIVGGTHKLDEEVIESKHSLYYVLLNLLMSSLLALIYTNDLFTAYVFVEINTIAACGLIMIRESGRTIVAATRYMIMSLVGSGMLLLGICITYDLTGHLLMLNIKEGVAGLVVDGRYPVPLLVAIALMCVGLAIKSALFPFHAWLPDAYGYSTVSSAAILSSLVSKGYIFLLIKIIYRVIGFDVYVSLGIINVLYIFGLSAMIFGSLRAIRENDVRRMIAYSSVAQIGYIYMGFGLGTFFGMEASIFHILSHGATKSLLFIAAIGLTDVSGCSRHFVDLTGSGYRDKSAGIAFTVGALSMVGVPLFSGFISKLLFAQAAIGVKGKIIPTLVVLAISVILNAIYFMKTVIRIYTPDAESVYKDDIARVRNHKLYSTVLVGFIAVNLILGIFSEPIMELIGQGINMFS